MSKPVDRSVELGKGKVLVRQEKRMEVRARTDRDVGKEK
jgi:hypothetical protein